MMRGPAPETEATLTRLAADVDADRGACLYLDRGDGSLDLVAAVGPAAGPSVAAPSVPGQGRPRSDGWLSRLVRRARPASAGAVTRLALPGQTLGYVELARERSEAFSESDLAIARVQLRRLVPAVSTRLGPRPIAWSAQLEAVQSVAAELTRLTSVEAISAALCTQTHRVVAFDNARVYVLRDDARTLEPVAFRPHAAEYEGESAAGLRVRVGEGITGWVAMSGRPLRVRDAGADPRAIDVPGSLDLTEESMLLAPLRSEGRVIGVVVLSRLGVDRFSDDELRLLGVLADQAAVAIENARLLGERDRHVSELAALLDISQAAGSASDEHQLASLLAAKLRRAAGLDGCVISRWDEQSGSLTTIGSDGRPASVPPRDPTTDRAARHVLLGDEPLLVDPATMVTEPAERARLDSVGAALSLLMPLSTAGRVVGLVELLSDRSDHHFHAGETAWLRTMTNQVASALENARLMHQLRDAAETDSVTGVYSHRHLQDRLRQETARAARSGSPLAVLMIDLDDFKRVNDEHGHQAGDRVLRAIARALRSAVRGADVVARYGGDEFVVLMPDTDAAEAAIVGDRARAAVSGLDHAMADGSNVHVSCSIGLAIHPQDGRSGRDLLRRADAAMYTHKRARRTAPGGADDEPSGPRGRRARGTGLAVVSADEGTPTDPHRQTAVPIEPDPRVPA
jgi:diguanylate cyclase (GGDEF)-like protein